MLQLRVDEIPPGMVLAVPVELGDRVLLQEGSVLTEGRLRRLAEIGIRTLYVVPGRRDDGSGGRRREILQHAQTVLTAATRRAAIRVLRRQLARLGLGQDLEARAILQAVHRILRELLQQPDILVQVAQVRALDDDLFVHQVQVAALSVLCGIHYGLTYQDLRGLGAGALLHDAGKILLEEQAWRQPRRLTHGEYRRIQEHPRLGFELLRRVPGLDMRAAHVAYQHHERWDGSGYPRGLKGAAIHPWARIVAVADVFDAITSDRPHRPAWSWQQAIEHVADGAGRLFEPKAARVFLGRLAPYPVGSWVVLNTGELACVVRQNPQLPARPVVRVVGCCRYPEGRHFLGAGGGRTGTEPNERELDLAAQLQIRIVGPCRAGVPGMQAMQEAAGL